tara:strand:+ start:893 stop:1687 length:795 start_codon:yes stop_codon:yes gene_type:complete
MKQLTLLLAMLAISFSAFANYELYSNGENILVKHMDNGLTVEQGIPCFNTEDGRIVCPKLPLCFKDQYGRPLCPRVDAKLPKWPEVNYSFDSGTNIGGYTVGERVIPLGVLDGGTYDSFGNRLVPIKSIKVTDEMKDFKESLSLRYDMYADFKDLLNTSFCELTELEGFCMTVKMCADGGSEKMCTSPTGDIPDILTACPKCIVDAAKAETAKKEAAFLALVPQECKHLESGSEDQQKCSVAVNKVTKCFAGDQPPSYCAKLIN